MCWGRAVITFYPLVMDKPHSLKATISHYQKDKLSLLRENAETIEVVTAKIVIYREDGMAFR